MSCCNTIVLKTTVRLQPNTDAHHTHSVFLENNKDVSGVTGFIFTCRWLYFIKYAPATKAILTDTQRDVYLAPGLRYRPSSIKKKHFETKDVCAGRQNLLEVWAVQDFGHLQYWGLRFGPPSKHSVSVFRVL